MNFLKNKYFFYLHSVKYECTVYLRKFEVGSDIRRIGQLSNLTQIPFKQIYFATNIKRQTQTKRLVPTYSKILTSYIKTKIIFLLIINAKNKK